MTQQSIHAEADPQLADLVDHLVQFDGPPEQFLPRLLAVQCRVGSAEGGAILRTGTDQEAEVLAVFPPTKEKEPSPSWLAQAAGSLGKALASTQTLRLPVNQPDQLYGQSPQAFLLLIPLRGGTSVRGAAAFYLAISDATILTQCQQRLELTISLLSLYEMRLNLQARQEDLQRLRRAMSLLDAVNEPDRFRSAAMAFCNEVASTFEADRVSLGILKGRYVRVEGMSHTEKIVRKMQLVQAIESTMEECLDQDVEVFHPSPTEAAFVNRAAAELATSHGPSMVCSMPMRRTREVRAIMTVERGHDKPFTVDEIETLRVTADLCTARLLELKDHDKWIGAKAADATRRGLGALVGPRYTWVKAVVVGVFLAVLFLTLYPASHRVDAHVEVQTISDQVIAAPFGPARIEEVHVKPNDEVVANVTVLVTLETAELRSAMAQSTAEHAAALKAAEVARQEGKTAEKQIKELEAAQAEARMAQLNDRIDKAMIRSRISGKVVEGDLRGSEGATLQQGDVLMRVADVEHLRAELLVPEKRIGTVMKKIDEPQDQGDAPDGELATQAFPGVYIPFTVDRVSPVAEVVDQRNVFRIWVTLQMEGLEKQIGLQPGFEGVAKINIGKKSYAWLWTRDVIDWLRMRLWW